MDHGVEVIQANPLGIGLAFGVAGPYADFLLEALLHPFGDGLHLHMALALANDEVFGGPIIELTQVELNDILPFDVLNAIDDEIVDRFDRWCIV